jgi:flavin prenyltransferase
MIVVPCSMKTVAGISSGYSDNLLLRAADVTIKERRKLILVARETPLSPIHLRNMEYLSRLQNVVILPPVISYYSKPKSLEDINHHIAGKILDAAGIKIEGFKRWE